MKKNSGALIAIGAVMLALPWAAVTFAPGDAGMAICFVLFFGLNPMCSMFVGIWSGMEVKARWYLPIVNAAAFLLSAWLLFDRGEPAFLWYAVAYLTVSLLAMIVTIFIVRGIRRELNR